MYAERHEAVDEEISFPQEQKADEKGRKIQRMIEHRETSPQKVINNIFALLRIKGISYSQAGKRCGFSTGYFSEMKKHSRKNYPETKNLLKFCELFGVTLEELFYKDYVSVLENRRIQEIDAEIAKLKKERETITAGMIRRARDRSREIEEKIAEELEQ